MGCQLTASSPSYLKANPIKIIILTSAPHQACLDDTSTQAKRTSICQCLPIERKGSTLIGWIVISDGYARVCNTGNLFAPATRGIHLAVEEPEREIVLHSTTLSLPTSVVYMENHVTVFFLFVLTRRNARY